MDYTTTTLPVSNVIDIDTLKAEALHLNLTPNQPNLNRISRALAIVDAHGVSEIDNAGSTRIYEVSSQSRDLVHLVVSNGQNRCTCEDARKRQGFTGCKHSIAVQLYEERIADMNDWLESQEEKEWQC